MSVVRACCVTEEWFSGTMSRSEREIQWQGGCKCHWCFVMEGVVAGVPGDGVMQGVASVLGGSGSICGGGAGQGSAVRSCK